MATRLHLIVVWFHWKLRTKNEENCSGRSRVRIILFTCIHLHLLQFLPCKFQEHWKQGRLLNRASNMTNFPPQILCLQVSIHIIHWHCLQISYARAHLAKRNKFASKKTLDYFRKKYLEYANNWLVSQIAVRAETMNVTAHLVGYNT